VNVVVDPPLLSGGDPRRDFYGGGQHPAGDGGVLGGLERPVPVETKAQ
jgi:hypothetical protein